MLGNDSNSSNEAVLILTRRERFSGPINSLRVVFSVMPVFASTCRKNSFSAAPEICRRIEVTTQKTLDAPVAPSSARPCQNFLVHIATTANTSVVAKKRAVVTKAMTPESSNESVRSPRQRHIQPTWTDHDFAGMEPLTSGASEFISDSRLLPAGDLLHTASSSTRSSAASGAAGSSTLSQRSMASRRLA